jgi:hypothetical protein
MTLQKYIDSSTRELRMRNRNGLFIFLLGFSLLYARPYFDQFGSVVGYVGVGSGLLICGYCLLSVLPSLRLEGTDLILGWGATAFMVLSWLLLLLGEPAPEVRSLWLASAQQWLLIILLLYFRQYEATRRGLFYILFGFLVLQWGLSVLQYTFYTFGVGIPIRAEEYQEFFFVAGPYFNANDNSVYAVTALIAVIALCNNSRNQQIVPVSLLLVGCIVWLSLSRSMLLVYSILAVFTVLQMATSVGGVRRDRRAWRFVVRALALVLMLGWGLNAIYQDDSDVSKRSTQRAESLMLLGGDESVQARSISYLRLGGLLSNPWGSLSDLDYGEYFRTGDDLLMQTNPHSFLAESAFLYGFAGLIAAIAIMASICIGIAQNRVMSPLLRVACIGALFVGQSVSSSIMAAPLFFVPFVVAMKPRRSDMDDMVVEVRGSSSQAGIAARV